ncbi:opioid growth factor receptor-related protein [Marinobacter salarius]|uniref:opioid growth factor receptor-related protein n=1 Tax=Marinobacter salarius TaxID=1420917 RepID=UPI00273C1EFB|nr:opioid growth factor receptor-related protein [Marinobacter salarius]MDP4533486.1 opioid growth factor receptor-related protein [Marinobacter salarius]
MAKRIMSWKVGCVYPIPDAHVDDDGQLVLNRQSIGELSPELMTLMSDDVVATAFPECPAAAIYGYDRGERVREQLEALPTMEPESRRIQRVMLGHLHPLDKSNELKLSQPVTAYLLPKGARPDFCIVVFDSTSAEIWSYDKIVGIVGKPEPEDSALIKFYRGDGTDHVGRTLDDILAFDDFWLEHTHDYLQWLFPIPEPSQYSARVPVLTREDIAFFRTDRHLRTQQIRALDRMLAFYGLKRRDGGIFPLPGLNMRTHIWLKPAGHNHLRITRIIRSLQHCTQPGLARRLQSVVIELGRSVGQVKDQSIGYWLRATD